MLLKSEKYCYESLEINGLIYTMLTFRFTPVCCRFVIVIESAAVVLWAFCLKSGGCVDLMA